jgi:hypothetical protein
MIERQELHCHNCQQYVQFDLDLELEGNHVLTCPNCGHEHCRVIKAGQITGERWDNRNGNTYTVSTTGMTWSTGSTWTTSNSTSVFLYQSWSNSTTTNR